MKTLFLLLVFVFLLLGILGGASIFYLSKTSEFTRADGNVPRATPVPGGS